MSPTVLLADNKRHVLEAWASLLEQEGYQVITADTVAAAERALRQERIHLAVLDSRMVDDDDPNDISGLTLAQAPEFLPIPKIILTAFPSHKHARMVLSPNVENPPSAVSYVGKDEDPEIFSQAIEQAFAKHVRINWDLVIRWGAQSSLSPSDDWFGGQNDEIKDLFRKLFYEHTQVTIEQTLARREGWSLLSVIAYRDTGAGERFMLAIGRRETIAQERNHYGRHFPSRGTERTINLAETAETIHFGATAYRLMGGVTEGISSLTAFYPGHSADAITGTMDDLFETTLRLWYEKGRVRDRQTVESFCLQGLESNPQSLNQTELETRIESVCQASLASGIQDLDFSSHKLMIRSPGGTTVSYPNPAPYLYERRITTRPPTVCGITHGRLDGHSILTNRLGQTWVVDFEKMAYRPLICDFVSLETALKFEIIDGLDLWQRHEVESRLLAMSSLAAAVDAQNLPPATEKALLTIQSIRSHAARIVDPALEDYLTGLLFCATKRFLGHQPDLRYTRQEICTFAHILLAMAMLCQHLARPEDLPKDIPPEAQTSLWIDMQNREVWVEGQRITLAPQRFHLLAFLYTNANTLCTRPAIAKAVFSIDFDELKPAERSQIERDTINTAIRRLREDVEPDPANPRYIQTVWGAGYKLMLEHDPTPSS